jgi:hypothetical protein
MNIYKLTYSDIATARQDLYAKNILIEVEGMDGEKHEAYGEGVQAVVEIGVIALDENTNAEGYHYDVMSTEMYDFGSNLVEPKNPKHTFAGYSITDEVQPILPTEEI